MIQAIEAVLLSFRTAAMKYFVVSFGALVESFPRMQLYSFHVCLSQPLLSYYQPVCLHQCCRSTWTHSALGGAKVEWQQFKRCSHLIRGTGQKKGHPVWLYTFPQQFYIFLLCSYRYSLHKLTISLSHYRVTNTLYNWSRAVDSSMTVQHVLFECHVSELHTAQCLCDADNNSKAQCFLFWLMTLQKKSDLMSSCIKNDASCCKRLLITTVHTKPSLLQKSC